MNLDELKRTEQTTDTEILAMGEAETIEYCQAARHGLQTLIAAHEALQAELATVYGVMERNDFPVRVGEFTEIHTDIDGDTCHLDYLAFWQGDCMGRYPTLQEALRRAIELERGT